ncbi:cation transporter [Rhodospirillum rubrum]|uniref:cation:proton antiporter n=1 Tax=Rhodospirillum rubrum TaxID=1085 RepID=UPI001904B509|nr:cation:proton antiporter [Rhodospirillum rubrum]MBK1662960.1 cation transporter [Rhodospirillum rubrum]MBK1675247.1 cation transporter [Rhodospirillum rubrum]
MGWVVDSYIIVLVGFGALVLLTAWLPMVLREAPLSLPILCVAIGAAVFALPPLAGVVPRPQDHLPVIERVSEMLVILSLMGAGLKIDRPFGWKGWAVTGRLLGVAMPLTILGLALVGWLVLGLGAAAALLLAAALAPTDPVLASDIQVGPPNSGEESQTRFALTSEAGLNDALAFPFVHAALALAVAGQTGEPWLGHWLSVDIVWKLGAGLAMGVLVGRGLAWLLFRVPDRARLSRSGDGFVALGITCVVYGLTEMVQGYGFLAVFVAGLTLRAGERRHAYQGTLHDFAEALERLLMMALLVGFGAAISGAGLLAGLTWEGVVFGLIALVVVRPLTAWIGLAGTGGSLAERAIISLYGIRGIGSIYYLSYALGRGSFDGEDLLWSTLAFTILVSILLHGATVTPVMRAFERRQGRKEKPGR